MKDVAIIFLLLLSSCHGESFHVVCEESEKQALLRFKQELKDPSKRLSSWDAETDCCTWVGVVCHNLTGHVIQLQLRNPYQLGNHDPDYESLSQYKAEYEAYKTSKLGGKISPSLVDLKHLNHLDLSQNHFGGIPIPSFIGSLPSLQYLNLSEAGFEGAIPHELGNLTSLRFLSLRGQSSGTEFKLKVKSLQWLASLSSLERLEMSYVNLNSTRNWLQVINMLPSLVELQLSRCGLSRISPQLDVNFTSLAVLDISENEFDSSIPGWIFSLSSLVSLDLGSSNFEGPLVHNVPWNLTSLQALDFSHNYLSSCLPNWLFRLNRLLSLDLHDNEFEGPIPDGLLNLTSLRYLDMSQNNFNSTIPDWLYSLSHLESLDLDSNELQGTISSAVGNLTSAVMLDLSYNRLEGKVSKSLGGLCNLRELFLSGNKIGGQVSEMFQILSGCASDALESLGLEESKLSGHLSDQLVQFKSLRVLNLGSNSISGHIPASLGSLSSLSRLNLTGNQLNGTLPASLGSLSSLTELDLERNQLNGTLPESIGQLSNLEQLGISNNLLEGVVSEVHFANLTSLREFYASNNRLVLKVSPDWIPPFQCDRLHMRSWNLGDKFPSWLRTQKNFYALDLSSTGISDSIPDWFWNLSSVFTYLNLSHNQIHGRIPDIINLNVHFSMIYLSSNQFSGPLPRLSSNVTELDLSNNSFSGDLSHFLCDSKDEPNRLEILHLGKNFLFGKIPDCWMNWPSLRVIKLGGNNLTGILPSSMGLLDRLESLHLRNNSLSGEIPASLRNCTELVTLDLSENQFIGSIPRWIGEHLSKLIVFLCRSNKLHGEIPREFCHLASLQILDLSNNNLSGIIPQCVKNFTAMAATPEKSGLIDHLDQGGIFYSFYYGDFIENAILVTKGRESEYNTILTLVASIDLSNNNIHGEMPEELTNLLVLRFLNLSGNYLKGSIPEKIGDMKLLESLDLSRNQLSGEIPPSMTGLTFMSYLNLSSNNLTGKIPLSTQLQSFNASSFVGNHLCGPPLLKNCNLNGVRSDGENEGDEGWGGD